MIRWKMSELQFSRPGHCTRYEGPERMRHALLRCRYELQRFLAHWMSSCQAVPAANSDSMQVAGDGEGCQ